MPIQEQQAIKSCLDHCQVTLQDLQNIANSTQNQQVIAELNMATQSLNQCIQNCQTAQQQS